MCNRLQKVLLILLAVMVVVFSVLYLIISRQSGVKHQDNLYFPAPQGDSMVYTAKVDGQTASFTVENDGTVTYRWGDTVYGPYTVRQDPTAVPGGEWADIGLTGIEILEGDAILFRGGYNPPGANLIIQEDGEWYSGSFGVVYTVDNATYDGDGDLVDVHRPDLFDILIFSQKPETDAHRGDAIFWFLGLFAAGMAALSIRFADAIFRFDLSFRIRNPDSVEPSDWELFSRVLSWIVLIVVSFGVFVAGLILIYP